MCKKRWFTQSDGEKIFIRKWTDQSSKPKAIIQIAHGMAEHSQRYDQFAQFLTENQLIVYANDHRGHGETGARMGVMGYFAEQGGFERAVDDLWEMTAMIRTEHPGLPIILLGHSMGSFLVRRYIQRYPTSVDAVILSGTGFDKGLVGKVGRLLAKFEVKRLGPKTASPLMDRLSFGQYSKGLAETESWLSRDSQSVRDYENDPYCGFISTAKFYDDLLYGLKKIHQQSQVAKVNPSLPILLFSGTADPVGDYSKGVHRVVKQYQKHGIKSIDLKLYPEGRHEMLFEINREQVMRDILAWIIEVIS
ncbi:MAG TPA: alpha/beta hydrolase [Bacilli bacterium]|nr:alpha/beta hydrolase [Bacilli bacterium]